jgi:hypothetical protein
MVEFIHAYNSGQIKAALALLDDHIQGNDCDYQAVNVVSFSGREAAAECRPER